MAFGKHLIAQDLSLINELGRQPIRARRFCMEYRDRILFGTDLTPNSNYYRMCYRFLETDDEYFLSPEGSEFKDIWSWNFNIPFKPHTARPWYIYGIDLPEKVLTKIYAGNAEKIIPNLVVNA